MVFKDVVILPTCCENIQAPSFLTKSKYFLVHPNIETSLRGQDNSWEDKPQSEHLFETTYPNSSAHLRTLKLDFFLCHIGIRSVSTSQHCNEERSV